MSELICFMCLKSIQPYQGQATVCLNTGPGTPVYHLHLSDECLKAWCNSQIYNTWDLLTFYRREDV